MSIPKVMHEMNVYEIDGEEQRQLDMPKLVVESHWNRHAMVVVLVDGKRYTVAAGDITRAVTNATNVRRY